MYRVLLEIGDFRIYSYGFMIAIGVLVALYMLYRHARREGYDPEMVMESVLLVCISGMIGARILFVILTWEAYSQDLMSVFRLRDGGLSFYGAFALGLIVFLLWCKWRKYSFLLLADLYAPYVALGYTFGRIGCFLNGCCYGKVAEVPWAVVIPAVDNFPRHPAQLYAAAGSLVLFFLLRYLYRFKLYPGFNLLNLVMLYGLMRFLVEFFREEEAWWGFLSMAQVFSLLFLLLAGALSLALYYRHKPRRGQSKRKNKRK